MIDPSNATWCRYLHRERERALLLLLLRLFLTATILLIRKVAVSPWVALSLYPEWERESRRKSAARWRRCSHERTIVKARDGDMRDPRRALNMMLTATVLLSAVGSFVSMALPEECWICHGLMTEHTVLSASLLPSGEDRVLRV